MLLHLLFQGILRTLQKRLPFSSNGHLISSGNATPSVLFTVVFTFSPGLVGQREIGVSKNRCTPQIIHLNRVFHYKPSILGYPYFLETSKFYVKGKGKQQVKKNANTASTLCSKIFGIKKFLLKMGEVYMFFLFNCSLQSRESWCNHTVDGRNHAPVDR